jgi:hypothetical protein
MRNEIMCSLLADFEATYRVYEMWRDYRKACAHDTSEEGHISFSQWFKRERQRMIAAQENKEGVA